MNRRGHRSGNGKRTRIYTLLLKIMAMKRSDKIEEDLAMNNNY